MAGSHRLNGRGSPMKDDLSGGGSRYSRAIRESVWIYCPQLAWQLENVSSLVQGSRAVTVHAQPGTYDPTTSRLVKIHLADSSSWAELGNLKICFELVNKSQTAPLEFLRNPLIAFD